jgi:hypothetical protein
MEKVEKELPPVRPPESRLFGPSTPYPMLRVNLEIHMEEFVAWILDQGRTRITALQYSNLVSSMLRHGDIREDDIFSDVLTRYVVSTHKQRVSARKFYLRFLGFEMPNETAGQRLNAPMPQLKARVTRLARIIKVALVQMVDAKHAGAVTPSLDELYLEAEASYEELQAKRQAASGRLILNGAEPVDFMQTANAQAADNRPMLATVQPTKGATLKPVVVEDPDTDEELAELLRGLKNIAEE